MTERKIEVEKKKILEEMAYAWDRQVGESRLAYQLFCIYRDLGRTRSYDRVVEISSRSPNTVSKYASSFQWKARAAAYDDYMNHKMRVKLEEEVIQARIRQQALGADMQELAMAGINKIMESENPEELRPLDIARLAEVGVRIENLAIGQPSEIVREESKGEVKHTVEVLDKDLVAEVGRILAEKKSQEDESSEH